MKPALLLTSVLVLATMLLVAGCQTPTLPGDETADESAEGTTWEDSPTRSSTLSLGASIASSLAARAAGTGDRVYFRSSDIEFWSIGSVADIGTLVSAKYVQTVDFSADHSLEFSLGDSAESIVFRPDSDTRQSIYGRDLNPHWEQDVAAFLATGRNVINAIRLDIGAGHVTFVMDGEAREVFTASGEPANGINGNSIFFVDEAFLSEPVLITRDSEQQVIGGAATAASLGISDADFAVVHALHTSSNWADSETPIDVNGALILPMTPVDISGFNPSTETLDIVVSWEVANAVHERDGEYFVDNRVGGRPFNFGVALVRGEYTEDPAPDPGDPPQNPPEEHQDHTTRLEGTGISLDDYEVASTNASGETTWTWYEIKASAGPGTSGTAFVDAVPAIWDSLPTMAEITAAYGLPTGLGMVDTPYGVHATFLYDTGSLYFGSSGDNVLEIRFSDDNAPGFTHEGVGVGSALSDVTTAFGTPVSTVHGDIEWADRVLYVTPTGGGYIMYGSQGVRFFLRGEDEASLVVNAMYLFEPEA